MRKLHLSIAAAGDLKNILQYTFDNWGEIQFEKYKDTFQQAFDTLTLEPSTPLIKKRDELFIGCLSVHSGHHVVFFRLDNKDIEIVRILHEKMDFSNHLDTDEK